MKEYPLELSDFKRVFSFGTQYYLDPVKNTTGRTTGEPRGLGSILDSFNLGKLTEIGVEKIFTQFNKNKKYILDFEIKNNSKVKDEPDIIEIIDENQKRSPKIFLEIKNTSEKDRWIGLTEEQFNTIKRSAGNKKIFMIYASINSKITNNNPKTVDLTGMFLKEIEDKNKSKIFQKFADLNASCKIEFIISSKDLELFSFPFERGMCMYETNLFQEKNRKSFYTKDGIRKDILDIKKKRMKNSSIEIFLSKNTKAEKKQISLFKINGCFNLISKKNKKFIECISDVVIKNKIFGEFYLEKNKFYDFSLSTVGRDPKLKRNNIFISKKRVYQLINSGYIEKPEKIIEEIVEKI